MPAARASPFPRPERAPVGVPPAAQTARLDATDQGITFEGVQRAEVGRRLVHRTVALTLAARIARDEIAQAIQLDIECDPRPPFDAGSPANLAW